LKVTIDSSEPLTDTLRVVGALYNVTLEVAGDAESVTSPSDTAGKASSPAVAKPRTGRARAPRKSTTGRRARSGASKAGSASTSTVRAWARENGYAIADRGRVPAEVVAAYRKSRGNG
jgi:Lsr2